MFTLVITLHIVVALFIITLVLLQQGKGASMGASFGSGSSQTVFGSRGAAPFMFKLTAFFVAIFFITSLSLSYISKSNTDNQADTTGLTQADYQQQQAQKQQLIDKAQQLSHKDADKALPDLPENTQKDTNISGEAVKN